MAGVKLNLPAIGVAAAVPIGGKLADPPGMRKEARFFELDILKRGLLLSGNGTLWKISYRTKKVQLPGARDTRPGSCLSGVRSGRS